MSTEKRIVNGNGGVSPLNELRSRLYNNTLQILDLVKERMTIAGEISIEKRNLNMSPRNREREIEILESIPGLDEHQKAVLNMLFEITVLHQLEASPKLVLQKSEIDTEENLTIHGPKGILSYCLGLLISSPGFQLDSQECRNQNLSLGVIHRGGHVTQESSDEGDCGLVLVDQSGWTVAALDGNTMRISRSILDNSAAGKLLKVIKLESPEQEENLR